MHLILFKCEWFWAEINQLRNELSNNSRKKHHLRSICLNSLKYVKELKSLSQESLKIGSNLRLEYLSYVNLFEGIVRNELKEFSSAFKCLQKSKIIFDELIERNFQVSLIETKMSELETVMRVCQYSADMYDVVIEVNEDELNEFKVNQLTEQLSKTEIEEYSGNESILKIGSKTFELSSEIQLGKSNANNLKKARAILRKHGKQDENAHLQVAYFENRFYGKLVEKTLEQLIEKRYKGLKCSNVVKKFALSTGYSAEENISKSFNLAAKLFWNLSNIFDNESDALTASKNASEALEVIEIIRSSAYCHSELKIKVTMVIFMFRTKLIQLLTPFLVKKAIYSVMEAAPVPPKPSFYDMAFDCLSYKLDPAAAKILQQESAKKSPTSGFSNLLSGFWGKK